eukprot:7796136-Alexandrium_andersonii.AAC.1
MPPVLRERACDRTAAGAEGACRVDAPATSKAVVNIRIGSFNFGINQSMLNPIPWGQKHRAAFGAIVTALSPSECTGSEEDDPAPIDFVFGCEVGDADGGLEIAGISPSSLAKSCFSRSRPEVASRGPYLSIWNFNAKVASLARQRILAMGAGRHTVRTHWQVFLVAGHDLALLVGNLHVPIRRKSSHHPGEKRHRPGGPGFPGRSDGCLIRDQPCGLSG